MSILMAPGGTLKMALTALEAGAESVFVGPKGWSRRPASDELDDGEMSELLAYGRDNGKDIRVAINVMPMPDEIPAFLGKVEQAAAQGAGGVMICDPGCIKLVRDHFPDLDIHISVTAGVFNLEDIHFYRELGANIVVIPYRWGPKEVAEVRDGAGMKLEAFMFQNNARGRICPGRCYSSSYFQIDNSRDASGKNHAVGSASRGGSCHRICRGKWDLVVSDNLRPEAPTLKGSPELLLWELPEYVRLGVGRFKIPGRERSVGLVRDIVGFYRRALDHVLAGNDDVSGFEEEWNVIRHRWVTERSRRDDKRIETAASVAAE